MKKPDIRITARVTPAEKQKVERSAKRCGLSQTEYLRQRALGYEPRAVPPDALFLMTEKLGLLIEKDLSPAANEEALKLLHFIADTLISPGKEDLSKWQPQDSGQSGDG